MPNKVSRSIRKKNRGRCAAASLVLSLLALSGTGEALAQGSTAPPAALSDQARKGIDCYDALNFGCAKQSLQGALTKEEVKENKILLRQYLAYTFIALGDEEAATAQFIEIFKIDENFSLSPKNVSPKIYRVFRIARRRHEDEKARQEATILAESRKKIDDFFSGLVEPIQTGGASWYGVDLQSRWYFDLTGGFSLLAGDRLKGVSDAFEMGVTFGSRVLYGLSENLAVGAAVRYSTHPYRAVPGPKSLDILTLGGQVQLQEITDAFRFFLTMGSGAAWTGSDTIKDEKGWYVSPTGGVQAIVTNNLSLGITSGLCIVRSAGIPGQQSTFEIPVLFELNYIY